MEAPGQRACSTRKENYIIDQFSETARKKVFRWQVAVQSWAMVNGHRQDNAEGLLLKQIAHTLSVGQFSLDSLLFYARIDLNEPHQVKKNGRQIGFNSGTGRPVLGKSGPLVRAERHITSAFGMHANSQRITKPFEGRLWLMCHFFIPKDRYFTKDGEISKTLPDLSNLIELPQDCLQAPRIFKSGPKKGRMSKGGAGIIYNDNQVDSYDGSRRLPGESYRLELFLLRYRGQDGSADK